MAGVRETVDLDITAALNKVRQLEQAVSRVSHVPLSVDSGGTSAAVAGLRSVERGAADATTQTSRLGSSVDRVQAGLAALTSAFGVRIIVSGMFDAAKAASDLTESVTKSRAVFGETRSVAIEAFGDTASSIGLSKRAAVEAIGTFGNLFTSMGLGRDAAVGMSLELVKLSADIASFNNLPMEEALLKIRAGLVGEIEPLRTIGVSFNALQVEMKAAALGLTDVNGAVSESAKVQARYALILDLTKNAQGDFARTSSGFANQQRILKAEMTNLSAEIGAKVIPVLLAGTGALLDLLGVFQSLPGPVQTVVIVLGLLGAAGLAGVLVFTALSAGLQAAGVSAGVAAGGMRLLAGSLGALTVLVGIIALLDHFGATVKGVQINAEKLAAATGRELADGFLELKRSAVFGGDALEFFRKAVDTNREAAVRLRDQLKAEGEDVRELDAILQAAASAQAEQAKATGQGGAAASDAAKKFDELRKRVSEANDEIEAATGGAVKLGRAEIALRDTVRDLAAALGEGAQKGESLVEFQDRLAGGTFDVIDATKDYILAQAEAGEITGGNIGIQDALRSSLLEVARVFPELRAQIEAYIGSLSAMATSTAALISAGANIPGGGKENRNRQAQVEAENFLADQESQAQRTALQIAESLRKVGEVGRREGAAAGRKTAEATAKEVERTLRESARPGGGLDLGGFIVAGINLGEAETKVRANNFMLSVIDGMAGVVAAAEQIDPAEQLGILEALAAADKAGVDLSETRKKLGASSIEAAIAEGRLRAAQENVNKVTLDAIDATDAVADAQARQETETARLREANDRLTRSMRQGLDASLSALEAARGLASAQRELRDAQRSLAGLEERDAQLPGEIAAAERDLSAARAAAATVTTRESLAIVQARQRVRQAEKTLADTRADSGATADDLTEATLELAVAEDDLRAAMEEGSATTREVADAERALAELREEQAKVTDEMSAATERVTDSQLALVDAQLALIDAGRDLIGQQAGFEEFFRSIAIQAGLTTAAVDALIASMRRAAGASRGTGPFGGYDTFEEFFNNQTEEDQRGLLDLGRFGLTPVAALAGGGPSSTTYNVNIYPKQAVYDERSMLETFGTLELMQR